VLECFVSEDPVGFSGGVNWYRYASNDPTVFVDLTGLTPDKGDLIQRVTCHRDCADLFGGLPNVLAIAVTNYIDVNNILGVNVEADVLQQFEDPSVAAFTSAP
jgi:uncharacterized protein RhaS with RHS repeats